MNESKEIKAGDVVCLNSSVGVDKLFRMTVGDIGNGIATCYWIVDGEIKTGKIPVVVLTLVIGRTQQ